MQPQESILARLASFGAPTGADLPEPRRPLVEVQIEADDRFALAARLGGLDRAASDATTRAVNALLSRSALPRTVSIQLQGAPAGSAAEEDLLAGAALGCRAHALAVTEASSAPSAAAAPRLVLTAVGERARAEDNSPQIGDAAIGLIAEGPQGAGLELASDLLLDRLRWTLEQRQPNGGTLRSWFSTREKSYFGVTRDPMLEGRIRGLAAVGAEGGGLLGALRRVLPSKRALALSLGSWPTPRMYGILASAARLETRHLLEAFAVGLGAVWICDPSDVASFQQWLGLWHEPAWVIGQVVELAEGAEPVQWDPAAGLRITDT